MAYCVDADVRKYAPQIPAGEDVSGYILDADGMVDAELRGFFTIPLSVVDQFIVMIAAKLAAGHFLVAYYSIHSSDPSAYANELIASAMKELARIKSDPAMLSAEVVSSADLDDEKAGIIIDEGDDGGPIFDMGDASGWGNL